MKKSFEYLVGSKISEKDDAILFQFDDGGKTYIKWIQRSDIQYTDIDEVSPGVDRITFNGQVLIDLSTTMPE